MRESEIVTLVKLVNAGFQNAKPVPPEALPLWFEDLADLDAQHVRAAFTAYRRSGKEFPPTCAELRRLVLELQEPTPRFEHAWAAIQAAVARHGLYCESEAQDALAGVPMAWDLVLAMGGWRCICLGGPDEYQATAPGVWRSQAEHAWRALVEELRTDRSVADIDMPLPRIREANRRLAGLPQPALAPLAPAFEVPRLALPPASPETGRQLAARVLAANQQRPVEMKPEYRVEIELAIREGREAKLSPRWQPFVEQVRREMGA